MAPLPILQPGNVERKPSCGGCTIHIDRAVAGDGIVQTWLERLDSWYDTDNGEQGSLNGCRY